MHKFIEVLFEVDGIIRRLSSTIGVKQGDLLEPELFTYFMWQGWWRQQTWRSGHDYEYCTVYVENKGRLRAHGGRNPNTGGKNVFGKQYYDFAVSDSEYADDTAIPFWCNQADAEKYARRYSWNIFVVGVWRSMQDPTTLSRVQKPKCYSMLALFQHIKTRARVTTRVYERSNLIAKWTFCTRGDQVQIPRLLYFKRWIWHNRCSISDQFCSSCCWGIIQMHLPITKHWSESQKCCRVPKPSTH